MDIVLATHWFAATTLTQHPSGVQANAAEPDRPAPLASHSNPPCTPSNSFTLDRYLASPAHHSSESTASSLIYYTPSSTLHSDPSLPDPFTSHSSNYYLSDHHEPTMPATLNIPVLSEDEKNIILDMQYTPPSWNWDPTEAEIQAMWDAPLNDIQDSIRVAPPSPEHINAEIQAIWNGPIDNDKDSMRTAPPDEFFTPCQTPVQKSRGSRIASIGRHLLPNGIANYLDNLFHGRTTHRKGFKRALSRASSLA